MSDGADPVGADITAAAPASFAEKATGAWGPMLLLAVLAGAFIALGGIAFLVAQAAMPPSGATQLLSGAVFAVGLMLVVTTGAELFTGNTMFVLATARGTLRPGRMLGAWGLVWIGNLVGSLIVAALFVAAGGGEGVDGGVARAAVATATAKAAKGTGALIASGVLANMLVCLAVWGAMGARTLVARAVAIVGPVAVFVAAGFEHSVANQSLLPIGAWLGAEVTLGAVARNLASSTVGNVLGGAGVALALGWAQRETSASSGGSD